MTTTTYQTNLSFCALVVRFKIFIQGIAIDEFPQMDGEYHPCTPSYKVTLPY